VEEVVEQVWNHICKRSAPPLKILHERILVLVKYVSDVIAGQAPKDHTTLRALTALIASLPATENKDFRVEFETEYEDVQLTAFLSALTKSANILNDLVDKHVVLTANREGGFGRRTRLGRQGDWDRVG
jgi:COP9 signalosome complex subunit 6